MPFLFALFYPPGAVLRRAGSPYDMIISKNGFDFNIGTERAPFQKHLSFRSLLHFSTFPQR